MSTTNKRILVTGGGTFLGDAIATALLAEGAEVTLLVREGAEDNLGILQQRARCQTADVWTPASLKGRGRGHHAVINTVGSLKADPKQGHSYHNLNVVSARNVINMAVSSGVPYVILMSAAAAPWINPQYIASKREAEAYLQRIGLRNSIIRAPLVYRRGAARPLFYQFLTLLGSVPPTSWLGFGRSAPMPIDMLARGVARIALQEQQQKQFYWAGDLRKLNKPEERRNPIQLPSDPSAENQDRVTPFMLMDDNTQFGWTPERWNDDSR